MFEVPEAKRVRREDLEESEDSGGSDSGADEQIRAQLEAQIARSLGLDFAAPGQTNATSSHRASSNVASNQERGHREMEDGDQDAAPEEYDFCLFGGSGAAPTKVVLEDDSEPQGEGGLRSSRPLSFYLSQDLTQEQKQQFKAAAVTGDDVLARSQWRWWSMELPWKVTHIVAAKNSGSPEQISSPCDPDAAAKRRRPGKKRRLALRMKERAKKEKAADAAQQKEDKEEHLKEKKKRLNRAKKLKRREKEREKKLAANGPDGATDLGGESDGSE